MNMASFWQVSEGFHSKTQIRCAQKRAPMLGAVRSSSFGKRSERQKKIVSSATTKLTEPTDVSDVLPTPTTDTALDDTVASPSPAPVRSWSFGRRTKRAKPKADGVDAAASQSGIVPTVPARRALSFTRRSDRQEGLVSKIVRSASFGKRPDRRKAKAAEVAKESAEVELARLKEQLRAQAQQLSDQMMRLKLLEAEKQQKGGKQAAAAADDIVKYDITVKANMKPGRKYRFPVPGSVQGTYERVTFKIPEDATVGQTISFELSTSWVDKRIRTRAAIALQARARGRQARTWTQGGRAGLVAPHQRAAVSSTAAVVKVAGRAVATVEEATATAVLKANAKTARPPPCRAPRAQRVSSDGSEMEEDDSSDDDGTPNRGRRRSSYLEMRSIALAEAPARAEDTSPRFHRRSERL